MPKGTWHPKEAGWMKIFIPIRFPLMARSKEMVGCKYASPLGYNTNFNYVSRGRRCSKFDITDAYLHFYHMECFNALRTQVPEEALDLTCFKEKPNAHDTHAVLLWYEELGLHAFKYPSLHQWQVQLSMKIHFNCQDVFGIIATGAGKSTLIHLPILADMIWHFAKKQSLWSLSLQRHYQ